MRHLYLTVTWTAGLCALVASLCLTNPLPWLVVGLALLSTATVMLVRELRRIAARGRREPTLAELGLTQAGSTAEAAEWERVGRAQRLDELTGTLARS
jgi:membrane protein implicated in regulation of membrane protease activity